MKNLIRNNKPVLSRALVNVYPDSISFLVSRVRGYLCAACSVCLLLAFVQAPEKKDVPVKESIAWLEEQLNSLNQGKEYKSGDKKKFSISDCEFNFSHRVGNERTGLSVNSSFPLKDIASVKYASVSNDAKRSFDLQIVLDKSSASNASAFSPYVISLYTSNEALVRKITERLELAKWDCKSAK